MALQTARFLVERGADLNAVGGFGSTTLHPATYQGLNDVIESVAGHGAKPDVKVLLLRVMLGWASVKRAPTNQSRPLTPRALALDVEATGGLLYACRRHNSMPSTRDHRKPTDRGHAAASRLRAQERTEPFGVAAARLGTNRAPLGYSAASVGSPRS
jgi:hypothetical protein